MPWYREGTVTVTNGSTTVTGVGTNFAANARVGDAFIGPNGALHEVTNIASATVLAIFPAYGGATAAGAGYATAPIQGYVKQLADQAQSIIQQWGATLAGLGSVSTENVVPITKGGTGGITAAAARAGLELKRTAIADIVGTVSQSAGIPSGAIMESGTNSSGTYIRFADGTQICFKRAALGGVAIGSPAGSVFYSGAVSPGAFAATFVGLPTTEVIVQSSSGLCWNTVASDPTTLQFGTIYIISPTSTSVTITLNCVAIGRWF